MLANTQNATVPLKCKLPVPPSREMRPVSPVMHLVSLRMHHVLYESFLVSLQTHLISFESFLISFEYIIGTIVLHCNASVQIQLCEC